jgi:hypothetical protein
MKPNQVPEPRQEAHQTVRLPIDSKDTAPSIRTGFTDQRLTAPGGIIVWSHFLRQKRFRQHLRELLPHDPISPNAYDPTDVALGHIGGILCGADKLSRVAWWQSDPAVADVLGIEAVASQSTLSRFFDVVTQRTCQALGGLHSRAVPNLPSERAGYTLDLDSWALLHEDGHQEERGRGLYAARPQALSPPVDRRSGRGQDDRPLLAARGQHGLRQRRGGVPAPDRTGACPSTSGSGWGAATRALAMPACRTPARRWG